VLSFGGGTSSPTGSYQGSKEVCEGVTREAEATPGYYAWGWGVNCDES
jgi:hypothetical protein